MGAGIYQLLLYYAYLNLKQCKQYFQTYLLQQFYLSVAVNAIIIILIKGKTCFN